LEAYVRELDSADMTLRKWIVLPSKCMNQLANITMEYWSERGRRARIRRSKTCRECVWDKFAEYQAGYMINESMKRAPTANMLVCENSILPYITFYLVFSKHASTSVVYPTDMFSFRLHTTTKKIFRDG